MHQVLTRTRNHLDAALARSHSMSCRDRQCVPGYGWRSLPRMYDLQKGARSHQPARRMHPVESQAAPGLTEQPLPECYPSRSCPWHSRRREQMIPDADFSISRALLLILKIATIAHYCPLWTARKEPQGTGKNPIPIQIPSASADKPRHDESTSSPCPPRRRIRRHFRHAVGGYTDATDRSRRSPRARYLGTDGTRNRPAYRRGPEAPQKALNLFRETFRCCVAPSLQQPCKNFPETRRWF